MATIQSFIDELCWRAWVTLGVSGVAPPITKALIDPEALLVLTATACSDQRLRDEVLDWCAKYSGYVATTRLRNLRKIIYAPSLHRLREFIGVLNASYPSLRWGGGTQKEKARALSGKSKLNDLQSPVLGRLRYRGLFGTTSRSEILLYLRNEPGKVSAFDISKHVHYAKGVVAETLEELSAVGLLQRSTAGNRKLYEFQRPKKMDAFAGAIAPDSIPWSGLCYGLPLVLTLLNKKPTLARVHLTELQKRALISLKEPSIDGMRAFLSNLVSQV